MDYRKLRVLCSDGVVVELGSDITAQITKLKCFADTLNSNNPIPLQEVRSPILNKIVEFC